MENIAQYIDRALKSKSKEEINIIKEEVKTFTKDFPIPGIDNL